jgi:hypothetical protein
MFIDQQAVTYGFKYKLVLTHTNKRVEKTYFYDIDSALDFAMAHDCNWVLTILTKE